MCHTMFVIQVRGCSALMLASVMGKTEVVVELVKAGADVDMQAEVRHIMYIRACYEPQYQSPHYSNNM